MENIYIIRKWENVLAALYGFAIGGIMVYGYDNYRWMNVNIESAILTPEFYEPSAEQIII